MPRFSLVNWIPKLLVSLFCAHAPLRVADTAGGMHQPLAFHNQKAIVLIFVAVDCPISNSYAPEINRIIAEDKDKPFDFYIVYSDPHLSMHDAANHTKEFAYTCPALVDHDRLLLKKVDATVTPEVAVLDGHGSPLYEGRIDDRYQDLGKQRYAATTHDLRDALDAILAGKKIATPVTKAVGCPI